MADALTEDDGLTSCIALYPNPTIAKARINISFFFIWRTLLSKVMD